MKVRKWHRLQRPQPFRATTLGSVLPARAAGPLRGQRAVRLLGVRLLGVQLCASSC